MFEVSHHFFLTVLPRPKQLYTFLIFQIRLVWKLFSVHLSKISRKWLIWVAQPGCDSQSQLLYSSLVTTRSACPLLSLETNNTAVLSGVAKQQNCNWQHTHAHTHYADSEHKHPLHHAARHLVWLLDGWFLSGGGGTWVVPRPMTDGISRSRPNASKEKVMIYLIDRLQPAHINGNSIRC